MTSNLEATTLMRSPLMVALVTHWLKSGVADRIILAIRSEASGRQQLARTLLKGVSYAAVKWTPSLAAIAAPVESCGVSVPVSFDMAWPS